MEHQDKPSKVKTDKNTKSIGRFLAKIHKTETCWIWTGAKNQYGYGVLTVQYKLRPAHRFSYETFVGPIPEGHDVCHTCDVRNCVNPSHLWTGPARENLLDMCRKGRHRSMPNAPHRTGEAISALVAEYMRCHPLAKKRGAA
jgi:hypothetical protein